MALTDTADVRVTNRAIHSDAQVFVEGDLAVDGATELDGAVTMNSTLRTTGALQLGATTTAALTLGGGTSATRLTTATADKNFLGFWTETTATSGDCRGMYLRTYFSGAGGAGEAARIYATVNNVTVGGTVNGAHITLNVTGASGKVSGGANALRCTLDFADSPTAINGGNGSLAVITADTNIATGPTIPTGTSFLRCANIGTQKLTHLMQLIAPDSTMFANAGASNAGTSGGKAADKVVRIAVDGVDYYVPLFASNA